MHTGDLISQHENEKKIVSACCGYIALEMSRPCGALKRLVKVRSYCIVISASSVCIDMTDGGPLLTDVECDRDGYGAHHLTCNRVLV